MNRLSYRSVRRGFLSTGFPSRGFLGTLFALGILCVPLAFVHASGTATIESLSPGTTANVGSAVSFTISTTGFTNPYFQVSDSFQNTSLESDNINYYGGNFAWNPIASDVGTHNITVTVRDSLGDSAVVTQQITVNPVGTPSISVYDLTPGSSIPAGQTLSFFILASAFKFQNESYTVSDSFSGSSLTASDISASGKLTWTPTSSDVGTHNISITASDTDGDTANVEEVITVTPSSVTTNPTTTTTSSASTLSIQALSSPTATVGQEFTFSTLGTGFSGPTYTVSDSFGGSTVSNSDINSSGNFAWTPTPNDIGTHELTVTGTDSSGHTASASVSVSVVANTSSTSSVTTTSTTAALPTTDATSVEVTVATTTTPFVFSASLYPGLKSSDVTNLQEFLTQNNFYSGPITGYYGALTTAAVSAFQTAHSITAIGTVGPLTLAAINQIGFTPSATSTDDTATDTSTSDVATTTTTTSTTTNSGGGYLFTTLLTSGSTGTAVTELQNRLTALGFYSGPITGYYGALTTAAVKAFQTAHSLTPVGYTGPKTRAALNS